VRRLALTPLLLMFRPALRPILARGLVMRMPFEVMRTLGLRMVMSFFLRFVIFFLAVRGRLSRMAVGRLLGLG